MSIQHPQFYQHREIVLTTTTKFHMTSFLPVTEVFLKICGGVRASLYTLRLCHRVPTYLPSTRMPSNFAHQGLGKNEEITSRFFASISHQALKISYMLKLVTMAIEKVKCTTNLVVWLFLTWNTLLFKVQECLAQLTITPLSKD